MYVGEFIRLSLRVASDLADADVFVPDQLEPLGIEVRDRIGGPQADDSFSTYLRRIVRAPDLTALGRRVAGWISQAELRDLLRWNLPTRSEWEALPEIDVGSKICESQWLADRFLLTYVGDWYTASLHEEFKWARGANATAVPPEYVDLRSVPADRLNAEIAVRAVEGGGRDPRSLLMTGVEFLQNGDHEQAIALFQGALTVSPSTWVRNCLAFCLVPSDPAGAALMFRELLGEGFDPPLLHANMAATSRLQGDMKSAHSHAREGLELLAEAGDRVAYLWGFEDGAPVLMADISLMDYLRFVLSWNP